jgi:hypothetical protein
MACWRKYNQSLKEREMRNEPKEVDEAKRRLLCIAQLAVFTVFSGQRLCFSHRKYIEDLYHLVSIL